MQNRQKHEIIRDVLTTCNGGSRISNIMFRSYLSHTQAKSYLTELIDSGLIETDLYDSKKYFSTAKGLAYLAALETMGEMLSLALRKAKIVA